MPKGKGGSFFPPTARITIDDFYARIHEDDRATTREAIDSSIGHKTPYDIVYRTVDPATREVKWIRALGGADYADDGSPLRFDGVTVDVTAHERDQQRLALLNQQLREQDKRKDEFIATLSHELRNPLSPILAAAKIVTSAAVSPAQLKRAQSIIERQLNRMALLLDDLLDVARITQGKLKLKKEVVILTDLIDAAIESVRPLLETKSQLLLSHLPPRPVEVVGDALRLSQVISNLLMNAVKYSPMGGRIDLTCSAEGEALSIAVKDNGVGIPRESIDGVFQMFTQLDGESDRAQGGLGIGLALVKGLAELHGGTVEARSEGKGHGSEFVVRLPLTKPAAPPKTAPLPPPLEASPKRRRILVADDNPDAAGSLAMLLELEGHDVRVAHLGRAALSLAETFRPDTVFLDIGMPDLSGYEVARLLRDASWTQSLRLIALTGWGQESDRLRAMEAGFDHHLVKPVDLKRLEEILRQDLPR